MKASWITGEVKQAEKTHRPMSKRDRRHKPGAKKPQRDGQMCFIEQHEKTASPALPNEEEMCNPLISPELMNSKSGEKRKKEKSYFSKNNPLHMKHCFAFNHPVIVNIV